MDSVYDKIKDALPAEIVNAATDEVAARFGAFVSVLKDEGKKNRYGYERKLTLRDGEAAVECLLGWEGSRSDTTEPKGLYLMLSGDILAQDGHAVHDEDLVQIRETRHEGSISSLVKAIEKYDLAEWYYEQAELFIESMRTRMNDMLYENATA